MNYSRRYDCLLLVSLLIFICCSILVRAIPPSQEPSPEARAHILLAEERWKELAQLVEATPHPSAELQYDYGLALAHLERWDEARKAFLAGRQRQPRDKRFPTELAGVSFKQKNYSRAAAYLRAAHRLDPGDAYVNDFLGTIYFLEGNLEAALKCWNRVEKPAVQEVKVQTGLHVNPVLLDHAFAFSPASILRLEELASTEARLMALEIFPGYRLDLAARPDQKFDLEFHAQERNGLGNGKLQSVVSLFRGLPFQEINPEYFNIGGSARNFASLLRWDAEKRRASASLSGPFLRNPKWHYRLGVDLRNENWDIRKSFSGPAPRLAALNLRREEVGAEITRLIGGRLSWSASASFSYRDYRNIFVGVALTPKLLAQGGELSEKAALNYELMRIPERRLTVGSAFSVEVGHLWSTPGESFTKLRAGLNSRWLPRPQGDDYDTRWQISAGDTLGQIPFDQLFILGLERDNDLWLRGHIGTRDGIKGSAPLGTRYLLGNWETDKNIYRNGLVTLKLGPLLDTGKIKGASSALNSNKWLVDIGAQLKISVLGVGVTVIYGKDLRSGNNAIYATVGR